MCAGDLFLRVSVNGCHIVRKTGLPCSHRCRETAASFRELHWMAQHICELPSLSFVLRPSDFPGNTHPTQHPLCLHAVAQTWCMGRTRISHSLKMHLQLQVTACSQQQCHQGCWPVLLGWEHPLQQEPGPPSSPPNQTWCQFSACSIATVMVDTPAFRAQKNPPDLHHVSVMRCTVWRRGSNRSSGIRAPLLGSGLLSDWRPTEERQVVSLDEICDDLCLVDEALTDIRFILVLF